MRPPGSPFVEYDDDLCGVAIAASRKIFDDTVLGFRVPIATVYLDRYVSVYFDPPLLGRGSLVNSLQPPRHFSQHPMVCVSSFNVVEITPN